MDDNRLAGRSSGLPRPMSRLPAPRATAIRPSPSKENLSESIGSEGKHTRLRPSASRERLNKGSSFGIGNFTNLPPPITSVKPTNSIPTAAKTLPRPRPTSYLPTSYSQPRLPKPAMNNAFSRLPRDPMAALPEQDSPQNQAPASKLPGLRRQASASLLYQGSVARKRTSSIGNISTSGASSNSPLQRSPAVEEEEEALEDVNRTRTLKPRPSLAERTMETLSHLQPSPALRSRVSNSNFFETEPTRSTSRPVSRRGSRPGSRRRSPSSDPPSLPSLSRPGSSAGPGQDVPTIGSFSSKLHAPDTPPTRGRTMGTLMKTPSTVGLNGTLRSKIASPPSARLSRSRTPSPPKSSLNVGTPIAGPQTMSARTVQARPSFSSLKRPSAPTLKTACTPSKPLRKGSSASQKSSTTASGEDSVSAVSSATTMQSATSGETSPQFKKSSAALREQIAKAKAAKRSAIQQTSIQLKGVGGGARSPMIPTDNTFDFGLADDPDPFNLQRDSNSTAKVLQTRLATARTSGRLNIAAMGLKEIPAEVLNMYSLESIGTHDGSWAESIDLTRFVAADNELEMIDEALFPDIDPEDLAEEDDALISIFGGLETLDLHGNMLISLPAGLRRLSLLTALNLSSNRLANNCLEVISQVTPLRDLKLGGNLLWGTLEPCFSRLANLEILDLHGNNLQALPPRFSELRRLRILNLGENSFESLPFDILSQLPLTELIVRKNKLTGVLVTDDVGSLPALQNLDVSSNQLTAIVRSNSSLEMPALMQLCASMNRIQGLPDISLWHELITLTADENSINAFPDGFTTLSKLKSVDFSSNDIRTVPAEIARMDNLSMLRLSGNPLRDKKFVSASIEELKATLETRLSPPPSELGVYENGDGLIAEAITSDEVTPLENAFGQPMTQPIHDGIEEEEKTDTEDFATPPTSAPVSPARVRSPSTALAWQVKPGGLLDRSNTQSSSLHPVACARLTNDNSVREVQLHHNLFAALPDSLSFFAETLTVLSVAHNQLVGETYLPSGEDLDLPVLKELNLSSNHITSLMPLVNHFHAPSLQKLDVSINRIAALPATVDKEKGGKLLKDAFPELDVLLIGNNHIADLNPESIRGLRVVDAANNDIAHLNPRIGLLGGSGGLEKLEVNGNRFRVPRWNVLERGTETTLRWLRGRVPVAEMASWRAERGVTEEEDVSDVD